MKKIILLISMPVFFLVLSSLVFSQVTTDIQQTIGKIEKNPIVNIEMSDVSVVEAINTVFANTNINYILKPGITGTISKMRLLDIRLDQAIKSIADAAKLEYSVTEDGTYVIGPKELSGVVVSTKENQSNDAQNQTVDTVQNWQMQDQGLPQDNFNYGVLNNQFDWFEPSYYMFQEQLFSGTAPVGTFEQPRTISRLQSRTQPPRTYYRPGRFSRAEDNLLIIQRNNIFNRNNMSFTE